MIGARRRGPAAGVARRRGGGGPRGRAWAASLALALAGTAQAAGLVLALHRVDDPAPFTYSPTAAQLATIVASLRDLGYRLVTVSDLIAGMAAAEGPAPRLAAVTFDDGDASVVRSALPVLRDLGAPATVFVLTDRLDRPGSLTRADLRLLADEGWEIGSHGAGHVYLPDLTPASARRDLAAAAAELDASVGPAPRCFAYPFGGHDARVRALAAELHACAVTTAPGIVGPASDLLTLARPGISFLDADGVAWRAERGIDPLSLTVAVAVTASVWPGAAAAGPATPPPGWQPAAWRELGHGGYEQVWADGALAERLDVRDGAWSLHGWRARALGPEAGSGLALGIARSLGDVTVAAAWVAGEGWGGGGAVDLAARGEAWAWWTPGGGWRAGGSFLLADGVRFAAAWRGLDDRVTAELRAALPLLPDEGRPVALAVGVDRALYARVTGRIGHHEVGVALDAHGRASASLRLRW